MITWVNHNYTTLIELFFFFSYAAVIYKSFGTKSIGKYSYNKEAVTSGELKLNVCMRINCCCSLFVCLFCFGCLYTNFKLFLSQAPAVPGDYEVRYYPAWLKSHYTGYRHSIYLLAKFNVNTSE